MKQIPQIGDYCKILRAGADSDKIGQTRIVVDVKQDVTDDNIKYYEIYLAGCDYPWEIHSEEDFDMLEIDKPRPVDDPRQYLAAVTGEGK